MSRIGSFAIFGFDFIDLGLIFAEVCLCFCRCHVKLVTGAVTSIVATWTLIKVFAYGPLCTFGECCGNSWLGFWVWLWWWWYRITFSFAFTFCLFTFAFSFAFGIVLALSNAFAFAFAFAFSFCLVFVLPYSFAFAFAFVAVSYTHLTLPTKA